MKILKNILFQSSLLLIPIIVLSKTILSLPISINYFRQGHELIGELTDKLIKNENITIPVDNIKDISSWADTIKKNPSFIWSRKLHYLSTNDNPPNECFIDTNLFSKENRNLYTSLTNYTEHLYQKEETIESFKFFIHFYQDLYQPLHISTSTYRGGNNYYVVYNSKETNLHTVWDNLLLKDRIHEFSTQEKYLDYLISKSKNYSSKIDPFNYQEIMKQNNKLNCNNVFYNISEHSNLDSSYYERNKEIVDNLIIECATNLKYIIKKLNFKNKD